MTTKHNDAAASADLTEDEQRALLGQAVAKYQAALKGKNDYTAKFIEVCKKIKADGVDLADVKDAVKMQTPEGEMQLAAKIAATLRVARWYNSTAFGTQFGLFDANGQEHAPNASFEAGKRAGLEGMIAKAPSGFDINEWLRGHAEGQMALASGIKQQKRRDADEFDVGGNATH